MNIGISNKGTVHAIGPDGHSVCGLATDAQLTTDFDDDSVARVCGRCTATLKSRGEEMPSSTPVDNGDRGHDLDLDEITFTILAWRGDTSEEFADEVAALAKKYGALDMTTTITPRQGRVTLV